MKPKHYRKECKTTYLILRKKHKKAGFQIKQYMRLIHENMVWEGKLELSKKHFNLIWFIHELDKT